MEINALKESSKLKQALKDGKNEFVFQFKIWIIRSLLELLLFSDIPVRRNVLFLLYSKFFKSFKLLFFFYLLNIFIIKDILLKKT